MTENFGAREVRNEDCHNNNDASAKFHDDLCNDSFKMPALPDLAEEREKLSPAGKLIYDGMKEHNGIKLKQALDGLPDTELRSELEKVTWLFNKGLGGGACYSIAVDNEAMHVFYMTHDGSGVEMYSRAYDPAADVKMADDFNNEAVRKRSIDEVFVDPEAADVMNSRELSSSEKELYVGMTARDGMRIRSALSKMQTEQEIENNVSHVASMINADAPTIIIGADKEHLKITYCRFPGEGQELYSGPYPRKN